MACCCCLILMKIKFLALTYLFTAPLRKMAVELDAIHLFQKLTGQLEDQQDVQLIIVA